ncbi:MAG: VWA domain-containing protein [Gammaproteobacteria bacterium]|nr:VWA domain-containing protein [Gammaproteobacteria bacterium]
MNFDWAAFHFAQPLWLWAVLAIPAVFWWARRRGAGKASARYKAFADAHLLPHLLVGHQAGRRAPRTWAWTWTWGAIWLLGVLALAGPRWDYTEIVFRQPDRALVVLLDISRSMDVEDVAPSRLRQARREIEDLINRRGEVRIGLVVFASIAHTVAPITEDSAALRRLLPYLDSGLGQLGGSRPLDALREARRLLGLEQGADAAKTGTTAQRDVLLISDGDFGNQPDLEAAVRAMHAEGVTLHVLGVGTDAGGEVPVIDPGSGDRALLIGPDRQPVRSALAPEVLQRLALAGGGRYFVGGERGPAIPRLLETLRQRDAEQAETSGRRVWNERFPALVAAMLILMAPWWLRRRRPR